jgi:hypothetical protein
MATPVDPIAEWLAPLVRLAGRNPDLSGLVYWADPDWPDAPSEDLEAEELAFYLEGLILEGFRVAWQVVASPRDPGVADHIRLWVQEGDAVPLDLPPPPGPVLDMQRWPRLS